MYHVIESDALLFRGLSLEQNYLYFEYGLKGKEIEIAETTIAVF